MEREFLDYTESLELKELGFDEPCFGYYDHQIKELDTISSEVCERLCKHDTHIKAPTFSQAFRWLREECGIWVTFEYDDCDCVEADICWYVGKCFRYGIGPLFLTNELGDFKTLQEAELECIKKLIEIVKEKLWKKN